MLLPLEAVFDPQVQGCKGLPSRPHRARKPPLPVRPRLCPGTRRPWMLGYAETNTLEQVYRFPPSPVLHGNRVDQEYNLPVQTWNVYNSTLDNDPRTNNNYSEGNNNALNQEVDCAHPSLPPLLQSLEYFNSDAKQSIPRIITGQHSGPKRKNKSLELEKKIVNAVQLYGLISLDMYCRSIDHLNS